MAILICYFTGAGGAEEAEEVRREEGGGGKAGPGPQEDRQGAGGLRFPAGQGVKPAACFTGASLAALATD